jgi:hypothetical protein
MQLAYQSQRQSPEERIRTRALRLRHFLNGSSEEFDAGLRDEDPDIDFDEEFDNYLDEELGEGGFQWLSECLILSDSTKILPIALIGAESRARHCLARFPYNIQKWAAILTFDNPDYRT